MRGTRVWVTEAMRRMPPKTTSAVKSDTTTPVTGPTHPASVPKLDETVSAIVLACSEENAKGKQISRMTAKSTPIHLARSPRCM